MAAQLLGNGGTWLPLLPALTDELADQRAFVLAGFVQQVIETVLGFGIEPDGERHGPQGLTQYDKWSNCNTGFAWSAMALDAA